SYAHRCAFRGGSRSSLQDTHAYRRESAVVPLAPWRLLAGSSHPAVIRTSAHAFAWAALQHIKPGRRCPDLADAADSPREAAAAAAAAPDAPTAAAAAAAGSRAASASAAAAAASAAAATAPPG